MKKLLSALLAVSLTAACLAGCGEKPEASKKESTPNNDSVSTSQTAQPLEIKWMADNQPSGEFCNPDSETKKMIEEKFNVKLTLESVDIHNVEQYNLYWASGNSPDYAVTNKPNIAMKLVDQNLVREIPKGYLEKYMPDWMNTIYSFMDESMVKPQITKNGKEYIIPFAGLPLPAVLSVRQDWL